MAAKSKLALTQPTSIPLDKLLLSDGNVRRVNAAISIEALAESITRRGLLQSLSVRPVLDAEGGDTGKYEVQAGGRRLRALKLLVKHKRLAKDAPIPCIVKTTGILEDDSLAENTDREALHPLDQFRAFAALRDKNRSEEDIAAAFGVTPAVVRQRLKLVRANPVVSLNDLRSHVLAEFGVRYTPAGLKNMLRKQLGIFLSMPSAQSPQTEA